MTSSCRTCFLLFALFGICSGTSRRYFIVAKDIEWDYSDNSDVNLVDPNDQASADKFLKTSSNRIGSTYKKTTYFEYTDATFTTEIPKPSYLGLIGPIIRGEVGDDIHITFFNNASGTYSMHAHGVFYLKEHEGALYVDGTSGRYKNDEIVLPGAKVDLVWNVTEHDAPDAGDPGCIPWVYHSHVETVQDTSAGLLGFLVTCKKGILDANNRRLDVDLEYPLLLKSWDENLSWFIEDNIDNHCGDPSECRQLMEDEDEDFIESNYMRSINGKMYGHLSGLKACVGDRVAFYVVGFGNEFDVHALHFHGQNLKYQHTRGDTIAVFSATFVAAETVPERAGYWLMADMVGDNERDGMAAFFFTTHCNVSNESTVTPTPGVTREYFLTAEEVLWDYGPTGVDGRTGLPLTYPGSLSETYFKKTPTTIGQNYKKAKFIQYQDDTFTTKTPVASEMEHLGILGPVLRLEVGDTLKITLKNRIQYPVSILPHALSYNFMDEMPGVSDVGISVPGGAVPVNQSYTYYFHAPDDLLQNITRPCQNYLYTSAHDPSRDHNTGLVGPLLVCRKGYLSSAPEHTHEFFLLLTGFDENKSLFLQDNINTYIPAASRPGIEDNEDFSASNLMFSMNGYSFGNLPNLTMCLNDNITWYVMSLGSDLDVHTVTFDGNVYVESGKHRDVRQLVSGSTAALHMVPDNPGTWSVLSHSNLARDAGLCAFYTVKADCSDSVTSNPNEGSKGLIREFYIAAEEVDWDYAPLERSLITGSDLNDPRTGGHIFVVDDEDFIGDIYKKAVFRAYLDPTFQTRMPYEDILGPAIKVEVGDTVKILFKNMASRNYSMHAHGIMTTQQESGLNYGSANGVEPGNYQLYTWEVPERAGPGPNDPNCIPWLYFSSVDPVKDTNSGLVGPLVVCRQGTLDSFFERKDVDKEFYILMSVINENFSWYLDENVRKYAPNRVGTDYMSDPDFEESNKMHAINGRLFGNNPDFYVEYNSKVAWYMMSIGGELDLHTVHIHGHTFVHTSEKHRDDIIQMFPGMAESVEMIADNPGTWLLHCHVLDHIAAGMETTYTVLKPGQTVPKGADSPNIFVGK